jgi:Leucine-rich repeat (LRR) protein
MMTIFMIYEKEGVEMMANYSNWDFLEDPEMQASAREVICVDCGLTELPAEISKLSGLRGLNCSSNNLRYLPDSLTTMVNLEELYIMENKIIILPDGIGALKKLRRMEASYNELEVLPQSFGGLEGLRFLNLVYNRFKTFPPQLGDLRGLEKLFINNNYIKMIPEIIGSMTGLQILNLSNNRLWKALPACLVALENLRILYLENNCIAELPAELRGLRSLEELYVQDNQLIRIPPSIGACRALCVLNVSSNLLRTMPVEITQCTQLTVFKRENNELDLHPAIVRFLNHRRNVGIHGNIYRDRQNVHASSIQDSIKKTLLCLMNDPYSASKEEIVAAVVDSPYVEKKEILISYINDDRESHSTLYCTFFEAFVKVWGRIIGCDDMDRRGELFRRLNEELAEGECMCFTGRLSRLVNVLNGFYDDIVIQISSNEQIANVILTLRSQHGVGSNEDMSDIVKEAIRGELRQRGYEEDIIEVWLNV